MKTANLLIEDKRLNKDEKSKRDLNLDLMRFIGILIILLAHSNPPGWLFQLRNFGTPLLVVASALTYCKIYSSKKLIIKDFYFRRISRLLIPTWIFLSIFFLSIYIFNYSENYKVNLNYIFHSFLLSGGKVGYLFIFKVYIFLALITPFALYIKLKISDLKTYYLFVLGSYLCYEILSSLTPLIFDKQLLSLLNTNVWVFVAFSIIYLYGLRLNELSPKAILIVSFISFAVFLILAFQKYHETGHFVQTQTDKSPPHIYYLSYAFFCLNIMYLISSKYLIKIVSERIITWVSSNSLWVYLWHIMGIEIYSNLNLSLPNKFLSSIFMLVFIYGFAVIIYLLQKQLVEFFFINRKHKTLKFVGTYLT